MNTNTDISDRLKQAMQLKNSGNNIKAIQILHGILVEDHNCVSAYEELGDNYIALREAGKAEKALDHAVKLDPKASNARYLRGFLYSIQEKWQKSIEELREANELFPNHPEILRSLGWALYNTQKDVTGLALLERSDSLRPSDPNILCDLGVCYMNSKDFTRAKSSFQKVVDIDPHSAQAQECIHFLHLLEEKHLIA